MPKFILISSSGLNGVNITPFPKLGLIEYLGYKIRVKKIEREIEKAKEQERTNREGPIYYHVTSSEVAAKIMSTGIITPGEGGFVYAWKLPLTLEAVNNSGARFIGSGSVTISFRTNATFVPDPEIDGQTRPYKPVRTYFPGAIRVTDIHIVRFGRR